MNASIELTVRRGIEFLHIVLYSEKDVIYYAKKYIKQGWQVYSIDTGATVTITYNCQ